MDLRQGKFGLEMLLNGEDSEALRRFGYSMHETILGSHTLYVMAKVALNTGMNEPRALVRDKDVSVTLTSKPEAGTSAVVPEHLILGDQIHKNLIVGESGIIVVRNPDARGLVRIK